MVPATLGVRLNTTVAEHEACNELVEEFIHEGLRRTWTVGNVKGTDKQQ